MQVDPHAPEVLTHGRRVSAPILNFYIGKNTPEREDYIMDKLIVPVEK